MPVSSASAATVAINNAVDAAAGGRSFAGSLRQAAADLRRAGSTASRVPSSLPSPPGSQSVQKLLYLALLSGAIRKAGDFPNLDLESQLGSLMAGINELRQSSEDAEAARLQLAEAQQQAVAQNLALASQMAAHLRRALTLKV